jgi:hypothetical protein
MSVRARLKNLEESLGAAVPEDTVSPTEKKPDVFERFKIDYLHDQEARAFPFFGALCRHVRYQPVQRLRARFVDDQSDGPRRGVGELGWKLIVAEEAARFLAGGGALASNQERAVDEAKRTVANQGANLLWAEVEKLDDAPSACPWFEYPPDVTDRIYELFEEFRNSPNYAPGFAGMREKFRRSREIHRQALQEHRDVGGAWSAALEETLQSKLVAREDEFPDLGN